MLAEHLGIAVHALVHYRYDPAGRLFEVDTDAVLSARYIHDDNGNRTGALRAGVPTLGTVSLPSGDTIEYVPDPAGGRIGKKVNGVLEQAWLYQDGLRPIAELDAWARWSRRSSTPRASTCPTTWCGPG